MRASLASEIIAKAKDQGINVVFVGKESKMVGARADTIIIDDDWAEFANSDDNEPLKLTEFKIKRTFKESKPQNNDWRKSRGFNGYHREF